jgi:cytochrome P450
MSSCPVMHGFAPLDPHASEEHLVSGWARSRREAPVFYVPEAGWWCVSTVEMFEEVLRRPEDFSSRLSGQPTLPVPEELRDRLPDGWPMVPNLASTDPPEHTRLRKLVQPAFTTRMVGNREPEIRDIAHGLIDGFAADGSADLATAYTRMIPIGVIAPIWGVPPEDGMRLYEWSHQAMLMVTNPELDDEMLLELAGSQADYDEYVRAVIDDRRANPRQDDLLTDLIEAEGEDGSKLGHGELMALVIAVISAGTETTATAMAHAIHTLLEDRRLWELVVSEPATIANAVEETIRARPPVRGITRVAAHDTELGGIAIPKDAIIHLPFLSVGQDEHLFGDDAASFDPRRQNAKRHLGFGKWTHFCLGAPLARIEMRVGIEALTERLPSLRLAEDCELNHYPSVGMPPLIDGLRVDWDV